LQRLALNRDPPDLCLPGSWDYRRVSLCPSCLGDHSRLDESMSVSVRTWPSEGLLCPALHVAHPPPILTVAYSSYLTEGEAEAQRADERRLV
jgi:hypothetical protein